jgi:benzodiazapine receptor
MVNKKTGSLICFFALVIFIECLGHFFTFSSVGTWYQTLQRPAWNPPAWIFAPVWTILYLSIAVSGWLVFIKAKSSAIKRVGFQIYGLQLLFNLLWSFLFFFLKSPDLAFLDILLLLLFISLTISNFWKIYRPAAFLLIPYLVWTLYAAALNLAIWSLN